MANIDNINDTMNVPESWNDNDLNIPDSTERVRKIGFPLKLFIGSVIVFLLAGGLVLYSFLNKSSTFSENRILVYSTGPGSITSGDSGQVTVSISNNNNTPLSDAYITVSYDSGENSNGEKNIINKKIDIGDVLAKNTVTESFNFSIFGAEGMVKELKPVFYYKVPNSKAEFTKESNTVSVILKSAPVSINVSSLKEVHQGYDTTFTISVRNNTSDEIKNLIVSARNPNNFAYSTSSLPLFSNNPSWKIASLPANSQKEITMTGKINGNIGDSPKFTFYDGISSQDLTSTSSGGTSSLQNFDNYNLNIDNIYSQVEKTINVTGQYLDMSLSSQNSNSKDTVYPGEVMTLELTYTNNLAFPIDNLRVNASLVSNVLDVNNIRTEGGQFDSQNMSILWDKNTLPDLAQIAAYGSGKLHLTLRVSDKANVGSTVRFVVAAIGDRNSEDNVSNTQDISIDKTWTVTPN